MRAALMGIAVAVLVFDSGRGLWAADDAASVFEPPVRLQADGTDIDTGEAWGHSGPTMADVDGDGKRDLVVGDFSGRFRVFPNVGTEAAPKFGRQRYLLVGGTKENPMADGVEAKVPIYCCIGSSPFFVDYDGDGVLDMISGSYDPGECYLFRGWGNGQYRSRETIVGADGKPVLRVPDQQQVYQSYGSWPVMVDWDADGDLDLLVGGFDGTVFMRLNEGTREKPMLAAKNSPVMAGGKPLGVPDKHAAISVADWDGDGRWDLLSGSDLGGVYWYRNVGKSGAPEFEFEREVLPKKSDGNYIELDEAGAESKRGTRTQVFATDYNGDGKMDLLVGDFRSLKKMRPDLTADERGELTKIRDELNSLAQESRREMDAMQQAFKAKYPGEAAFSNAADAEWTANYKAHRASDATKARDTRVAELHQEMIYYLIRPSTVGPSDEYETTHGYVWLYLRK